MTKKPNTQSVESSVDASQLTLPGVPSIPAISEFESQVPNAANTLSVAALRLPQDFGSAAGVKKVLTTIPFRKPSGQVFFRIHPTWRLNAAILQLKDDGENYVVAPNLFAELTQDVRAKTVYTGVTREGNVFLWPVNLESEDGRLDSWSQSARKAAEMAERSWVRMVANRSIGAYDVYEATGQLGEPCWPEMTFDDVAKLAFRDRFIDTSNHPILKALRGEQ